MVLSMYARGLTINGSSSTSTLDFSARVTMMPSSPDTSSTAPISILAVGFGRWTRRRVLAPPAEFVTTVHAGRCGDVSVGRRG